MATATDYIDKIQGCNHDQLMELWLEHSVGTFDKEFWGKGKLLEYIVIRAFELEGAKVSYPYSVRDEVRKIELEQIDGAIHIDGFHALTECKDYTKEKIDIVPLAKMRNQLARRHSTIFGVFFSMTEFTESAEALVGYMAPQLIILWGKDDIDYCIKNKCFVECLKSKYEAAIEGCVYDYQYSVEMKKKKSGEPVCEPLF